MTEAKKLLAELADRGLLLYAAGDKLRYRPREAFTGEDLERMKAHKSELLELLRWDEAAAHELVRDALAYLAEFYAEGSSLGVLHEPGDQVDDAIARQDMFAVRAAVRDYVRAGLAEFRRRRPSESKGAA